MDTLGSLSSHLPNRPPVEQELASLEANVVAEFKTAARAVTRLYTLSGSKSKLLKSQGYMDCLNDLIQLITGANAETANLDPSSAANTSPAASSSAPFHNYNQPTVTLEGVLNWALNKQHDMNAQVSSSSTINPSARSSTSKESTRSSAANATTTAAHADSAQGSHASHPRTASRSNPASTTNQFTFTSSLHPAYLSTEVPPTTYNGNIFHYNPGSGKPAAASSSGPTDDNHSQKSTLAYHRTSPTLCDQDEVSDSDVLEDINDDEYPSRLNNHQRQQQHLKFRSRSSVPPEASSSSTASSSSATASSDIMQSCSGVSSSMTASSGGSSECVVPMEGDSAMYLNNGQLKVLGGLPGNPLKRNIYMTGGSSSSLGSGSLPVPSTTSALVSRDESVASPLAARNESPSPQMPQHHQHQSSSPSVDGATASSSHSGDGTYAAPVSAFCYHSNIETKRPRFS